MADAVEQRTASVGETEPAQQWVFPDTSALASGLANYICTAAQGSISAHGSFSLAISGGSLVKVLGKVAEAGEALHTDWSKWHIFWADERVVPLDNPDSNYLAASAPFLSQVPVPSAQVHSIADFTDAAKAAELYEVDLRMLVAQGTLRTSQGSSTTDGFPRLDLVLLGVGPDGHVASLFPGHAVLREAKRWVTPVTDSPKPPPKRITLTLPVLNAANRVGVVTAGAGKGPVLKRIFGAREEGGALPAQLLQGRGRELVWFLDADAAKSLE